LRREFLDARYRYIRPGRSDIFGERPCRRQQQQQDSNANRGTPTNNRLHRHIWVPAKSR
jgi:hypothetical protein